MERKMTSRCERFEALYEQTLPAFIEQDHIVIGCGAIGGVICQSLGQIGVKKVHLWDPDTVEEVNLGPQGFEQSLVKMKTPKVHARLVRIKDLSRETKISTMHSRFKSKSIHPENAFWWLMVDDLDARELIYNTAVKNNPAKIIDARMGGLAYEIYNPTDHPPNRYMDTIQFARDNPVRESCTTRSTPHCSMIAGAIAVNMALSGKSPFCVKGNLLSYDQEVIWQ
jgi:molybdopterin/thiamine biosynthesis adenylyltransferase